MFFFGVFGIDSKQKEIRSIKGIICKACGRMSSYVLIKEYNYFHIFFIPVHSWGAKFYLVSKCCNTVFEIPQELGERLERGEGCPVRDENLTAVRQYSNNGGSCIQCGNCGKFVDEGYSYCPYCGGKL